MDRESLRSAYEAIARLEDKEQQMIIWQSSEAMEAEYDDPDYPCLCGVTFPTLTGLDAHMMAHPPGKHGWDRFDNLDGGGDEWMQTVHQRVKRGYLAKIDPTTPAFDCACGSTWISEDGRDAHIAAGNCSSCKAFS